ncbi:hypothetical protein NQ318_006135, partial [Aromia moschata]
MSSEFKEEFMVASSDCCGASYSVELRQTLLARARLQEADQQADPHYIENILGLQSRSAGQFSQEGQQDNMIGHVTPPVSPQSNFPNMPTAPAVGDVNEPLNLSVKTEHKVRTKTAKESSGLGSGLEPLAEDADGKNKKKKARTTFTGRQIFELEKQFELKKYLSSSERSEMAKLLNVTETQ